MACMGGKVSIMFLRVLVAGLMLVSSSVASPVGFDVRQHLSTTSRYNAGKPVSDIIKDAPPLPPECEPIHLNLVARHGTRGPTKKRVDELELLVNQLAKHLENNPEENEKRPTWLRGYRSPWEGRKVGGELTQEGEEDMYNLGQRMRERFPQLFKYDYHPEIYPITATQVPRSAASAVAFGMGLFEGKGKLGGSKQRAFSVITDSRKDDIHLRFHESCMAYKESKKLRKPGVQKWQDEIYEEVGASVSTRHALNLTTEDAASLWLLCKQEAAVLDITDRACGLFNAAEVAFNALPSMLCVVSSTSIIFGETDTQSRLSFFNGLHVGVNVSFPVELMEWADDFQAHHLKGYGEAINYRMGVPLLKDVVTTMEKAISASEGREFEGALQVAKLRVAHAETIIPFSCLLGLFLEGPDVESLQSEEALKYSPRPPAQRTWKGSLVAPFGANTQLVLYKCPKDSLNFEGKSQADMEGSEYLVQVLHNEKPVTMPACDGKDFCPFAEFKETVAGPHLKYNFEKVCTVETAHVHPQDSWAQKFLSGIRNFFQWPSCSIHSLLHTDL